MSQANVNVPWAIAKLTPMIVLGVAVVMAAAWSTTHIVMASTQRSRGRVGVPPQEQRVRVEHEWPAAPGDVLRIEAGAGDIVVSAWDEPRVRLSAEKCVRLRPGALSTERDDGLGARLALTGIEIDSSRAGEVSVRSAHPGTLDVCVNYTVQAPRWLAVILRTGRGEVRCTALEGGIEVESHEGGVLLEGVRGPVRAATSAGRIAIRHAGGLAGDESIRCSTLDGAVEVSLPRPEAFFVEIESLGRRFASDFPIAFDALSRHDELRGRVGAGGGLVHIDSLDGPVALKALS